EQPSLGAQRVTMIRIESETQFPEAVGLSRALFEPDLMHTIAGAEDIASRDPFVALDQRGTMLRPLAMHRTAEAPVAAHIADEERIADDRREGFVVARPPARIQRQRDACAAQCR